MTTAQAPEMTTIGTATGRPRRRAVQSPRTTASVTTWQTQAACRGTDTEAFFSPLKQHQQAARRVCLECPVKASCLAWNREFDDKNYRWGIGGGLDDLQRRALEMEEQLGNVPNLEMSQALVSNRWRFRLGELRESCGSLEDIVHGLREEGLLVDEVTVRVALWWTGDEGSRVPKTCPDDRRTPGRRLREDHGELLLALRSTGMRLVDVAAYLGAPFTHVKRALEAIQAAEAAREQAQALDAASEAVEAA